MRPGKMKMTSVWPCRQALGVLAAIAITTAMDAGGLSVFSALQLFPLMGLFWYLERLPRQSVGMAWGRGRDYGLAVLDEVDAYLRERRSRAAALRREIETHSAPGLRGRLLARLGR